MKTRAEVQAFLEDFIGNENVYFQAPPNTGMSYPCIVYDFKRFDKHYADNKPYLVTGYWDVHHMYKSISNDLKEKSLDIEFFEFDRRMKSQGVYNDYYLLHQ